MTTTVTLVDETAAFLENGYGIVRTYKTTAGDTLRIMVNRDFYDFQSFAVADILSSAGEWTAIADTPVESWYPTTRLRPSDVKEVLGPIADALADRAIAILA
jgi:hypothetical protein